MDNAVNPRGVNPGRASPVQQFQPYTQSEPPPQSQQNFQPYTQAEPPPQSQQSQQSTQSDPPLERQGQTEAQGPGEATDGGGFVPDLPASYDNLGVDQIAIATALFLLEDLTKAPITIGLHAAWGHGKSSFMNFAKMHLLVAAVVRVVDRRKKRLKEDFFARSSQAICDFLWKSTGFCPRDPSDHQGASRDVDEMADNDGNCFSSWWSAWRAEHEMLLDPSVLAPLDVMDLASQVRIILRSRQRAVVEKLAAEEVVIVDFNAWQHHGEQEVWAGLAATIGRQLETSMGCWRRAGAILHYNIMHQGYGFVLSLCVPLVAAVALFLAGSLFAPKITEGLGIDQDKWDKRFYPVVAAVSFLATVWRLAALVQPVSDKIWSYMSDPVASHSKQLGYQNSVITDLQFLYRKLPKRGGMLPRVVVFVDDLDRCEDDKVVEVLQAVNLILGNCSFFTIMGLDVTSIQNAVHAFYNSSTDQETVKTNGPERFSMKEARLFLAKIIQIPLELPVLNGKQCASFVVELFGKEEERRAERTFNDLILPRLGIPVDKSGNDEDPQDSDSDTAWPVKAVGAHSISEEYIRKQSPTWKEEKIVFKRFEQSLPPNARMLKQLVNYYRLLRCILLRERKTLEVPKLVGWVVFIHVLPDDAGSLVQKVRGMGQEACVLASKDTFSFFDQHFAEHGAHREKRLWKQVKVAWGEGGCKPTLADVQSFGRFTGGNILGRTGLSTGDVRVASQTDIEGVVRRADKNGEELDLDKRRAGDRGQKGSDRAKGGARPAKEIVSKSEGKSISVEELMKGLDEGEEFLRQFEQ